MCRMAPPGFVYAYLANECAPDQSTGLSKLTAKPPSQAVPKLPSVKPRKKDLAPPSGSVYTAV